MSPEQTYKDSGSDIPPIHPLKVSARGSIWGMGNHRVGCGSATDLAFVLRVLNGRAAACCFSDPPYNIKIDGFVSGKGRHRIGSLFKVPGELSVEQYFALLRDSLSVMQACCDPTALIYACIDWRHVMEMTVAGRDCGMQLYQIVTWVKSNGGMGGIYRNQSEFICVFRAGDANPLDIVELGRRGRHRTNVWHYPGMASFGRDDLLGLHPTGQTRRHDCRCPPRRHETRPGRAR